MALDGIQGIYPRCLSVPHEGGAPDKHRGNFPKAMFVAKETAMKSLSCFAS